MVLTGVCSEAKAPGLQFLRQAGDNCSSCKEKEAAAATAVQAVFTGMLRHCRSAALYAYDMSWFYCILLWHTG
jgi:hypothetical protein